MRKNLLAALVMCVACFTFTGCKASDDASGPVPSAWPGESTSAAASADPTPSEVVPSEAPSTAPPSSAPVPHRTHHVTHPATRRAAVHRPRTHRAAPKPPAHPAGATARCNDGTYSYAAHHQGACSHHHGVAVFFK
jgi:hypothetical protein